MPKPPSTANAVGLLNGKQAKAFQGLTRHNLRRYHFWKLEATTQIIRVINKRQCLSNFFPPSCLSAPPVLIFIPPVLIFIPPSFNSHLSTPYQKLFLKLKEKYESSREGSHGQDHKANRLQRVISGMFVLSQISQAESVSAVWRVRELPFSGVIRSGRQTPYDREQSSSKEVLKSIRWRASKKKPFVREKAGHFWH